ncbi:glyoxalase [Flavobacterium sp. WC2421]|uniref:glyoxalase n=1 Tax=Flavobacterium sp. WC2421 TaxID=3234138 RepID=UPI003466488C
MEHKGKSIRPFIGAKNYAISRQFYQDLGFQEIILATNMSYFKLDNLGFYLQDAYVKDWVDNTMIFMEVEDVPQFYNNLLALDLTAKYIGVKLIPIREQLWGSECYLHDPSGILWHFGAFKAEK